MSENNINIDGNDFKNHFINTGFTFSNVVGKNYSISCSTNFETFGNPSLSMLVIGNDGNIQRTIYTTGEASLKTFDIGGEQFIKDELFSIRFRNMDFNSDSAIIDFCNEFGLPYYDDFTYDSDRDNDYIFEDKNSYYRGTTRNSLKSLQNGRSFTNFQKMDVESFKTRVKEIFVVTDLYESLINEEADKCLSDIYWLLFNDFKPEETVEAVLFGIEDTVCSDDLNDENPEESEEIPNDIEKQLLETEKIIEKNIKYSSIRINLLFRLYIGLFKFNGRYTHNTVKCEFIKNFINAIQDLAGNSKTDDAILSLFSRYDIFKDNKYDKYDRIIPGKNQKFRKYAEENKDLIFNLSKSTLCDVFSFMLNKVFPELKIGSKGQFDSKLKVPNLLVAMYLQQYFLIVNCKLRKCQYENCNNIFMPTRNNQIHCCDECTKAAANKRWYNNQKDIDSEEKITITISKKLLEKIDEKANQTGKSRNEIIQQYLDFANNNPEMKDVD